MAVIGEVIDTSIREIENRIHRLEELEPKNNFGYLDADKLQELGLKLIRLSGSIYNIKQAED